MQQTWWEQFFDEKQDIFLRVRQEGMLLITLIKSTDRKEICGYFVPNGSFRHIGTCDKVVQNGHVDGDYT